MEGDKVVMSEIFRFNETGIDQKGNGVGDRVPSGIRPVFESRLKVAGFALPPEMSGADLMQMRNGPERRHR